MNLDHLRHSLAHVLALGVKRLYPGVKFGIGPVTETGFFYDFDFGEVPPGESDLARLETEMKNIVKENLSFESQEVSAEEARKTFTDQSYKLELIDDLEKYGTTEFSEIEKLKTQDSKLKTKQPITLYTIGEFTDLCRGGHVPKTGDIPEDAFKLTHLAGAYWRGSEKNPQLTRIYGAAFESKKELEEHLAMLEEAKKRDHRKIGKELDLFVFSDLVGKGLPLWTAKGSVIRRELERFIVDEEIKRGYLHVYTPDIANLELYKTSGHYPYYKDSMYAPITIDEDEFMLRPMTCPHHFELYASRPRSYRELPMRIAELAKLYRYEQSGELTGLIRVRSFCLADAHILCRDEKQAVEEVSGALDLIEHVADIFGLKMGEQYRYRLSLGDRTNEEKFYKDDKAWDIAEKALRAMLKRRKSDFTEGPGEAAFYGPKIDVQMKNVYGKEDTAFTVQYDFSMPERFKLTYVDEDGTEKRPIVVHRSSIGAIERTIAFLIEHFAGAFPVWLAPVQVVVLPVSEKHTGYSSQILENLREAGVRVEMPDADETLGKRIRASELQKIPYILVVGDKEKDAGTVTVRKHGTDEQKTQKLDEFLAQIKTEIAQRSL